MEPRIYVPCVLGHKGLSFLRKESLMRTSPQGKCLFHKPARANATEVAGEFASKLLSNGLRSDYSKGGIYER